METNVLPGKIGPPGGIWTVCLRGICLRDYGYEELRRPGSSSTPSSFRRSIGEFTDIVEKEMYSFEDTGRVTASRCARRPTGRQNRGAPVITNGLLAWRTP